MATENEDKYFFEPGTYLATATSGAVVKSKGGDTYRYGIQFRLKEGEKSGNLITWFGGLGEKSAEFTAKTLVLVGWDQKEAIDKFKPHGDARIVIVTETMPATPEYPTPKPRSVVKYVNSVDGHEGMEKMAAKPEEARSAADSFMTRLTAVRKAGANAADAAKNNEFSNQAGGDDIPF